MENILHGPNLPNFPPVSLGIRLFDKMRQLDPEHILYIEVDTGKKTTYKEFLDLCCRLARALQNCGYKLDDVITVSSENNSLYYAPVVASLFLGMISGLLSHTYTAGETRHMLEIFQPKIIFCSIKVLTTFVEQKQKFKCIERIIVLEDEEVDGYDTLRTFINSYCERDFCVDKFKPVDVDPFNQVATIMASSGTTGLPKGVMVTHDNIWIRASQLIDPMWSLAKFEIVLLITPNFHAFGLTTNVANMTKGNTIIIMKRFDEKLFLQSAEKYKVTTVPIVSTVACILAKSQLLQYYDLSSIEEIFCGGAPLNEDVEETIIERFPKLKCLRQVYGMTETTFAVTITPTGQRKTGSSGKVVPGCSLKFRDLITGRALGPNQRGEICIKGRMVTKGYYRNPEATRNTFVGDWVHSGDLGYYDEEGYIFVVDRIKELLKYKGFQVSPTEIEGVLIKHPGINAVSVVGKPDELAGDLPAAFVVKQPGSDVTEDEIKKFVADRLSKFKHLHGGVYFVDDLPKTPTGKVMRKALRDAFIVRNAEKF